MSPGLEAARVVSEVARRAGENAAVKALNHFDESGTAARLQGAVTQAGGLIRGAPAEMRPVPRDSDNRAAAACLRGLGVSDAALVKAFNPTEGVAFSSAGNPVFVGRDSEGTARSMYRLDPSSNALQAVAGSDPRYGVSLQGENERLVVYNHPVSMLCESCTERPGVPSDHRLSVSTAPAESIALYLEAHPGVSRVELRLDAQTVASVTNGLAGMGFYGPEQARYVNPVPLRPPEAVILPDGQRAMVCGEPDHVAGLMNVWQGDNSLGYRGTCGLVSCQNVLRLFGTAASEDELVRYASQRKLCMADRTPEYSGGTNGPMRARILDEWGLPALVEKNPSPDRMAAAFDEGHGVIVGVNAGILWNDANYYGIGQSNHVVTVTGTARDQEGGLLGVYICDSGRNEDDDAGRFVPTDLWRDAVDVLGSTAVITIRSRKGGQEE